MPNFPSGPQWAAIMLSALHSDIPFVGPLANRRIHERAREGVHVASAVDPDRRGRRLHAAEVTRVSPHKRRLESWHSSYSPWPTWSMRGRSALAAAGCARRWRAPAAAPVAVR